MSIPTITVHDWNRNGPVYRIHRSLSGRRNRKARRRGDQSFDQVGRSTRFTEDGPASFMAYAHGDVEVYAFNRGHVYYVEQLVDGSAKAILVDAREDYALHVFKDGIEYLASQGLTDEQLEALLDDDEQLEQPSDVSDGAESQEPAPEGTLSESLPHTPEDVAALEESRNEQGPVVPVSPSGSIGLSDQGGGLPPTAEQLTPGEQADAEYGSTPESREAAYQAAAEELFPDTTPADAELDAEDTAADEATEAARDESADDLTDEELEALTAPEA